MAADIGLTALEGLLAPFGLTLQLLPEGTDIPGSYWGEREAGLVGHSLYLRNDTPVHSVLHEASHPGFLRILSPLAARPPKSTISCDIHHMSAVDYRMPV